MNKKLIIIIFLLFLNSCATPGSALLGPIITGAKTGSIYQASISYSTGKIINELVSSEISSKKKTIDLYKILPKKNEIQNPIIISSYKVIDITFSEVLEEEPLP
tara:strand:+ start:1168 stop:1479 length:312 start_codon:yes stop_codon:yes gene_type:complete